MQERHSLALARACEALQGALQQLDASGYPESAAASLREALAALEEILGQSPKSEVLDLIFSRFCIGK